MTAAPATILRQHLIDPEICIRCNTCEETCPVDAISHDSRNYVVDVSKCNWCNDCISPCPTGSIDNYRTVAKAKPYSLDDQFSWDELPAELSRAELAELAGDDGGAADTAAPAATASTAVASSAASAGQGGAQAPVFNSAQ